jgi:hypothetical protein
MKSKAYISFFDRVTNDALFGEGPILMTKSLTLWARPLWTLAALLGLEVHEYVSAPAGLASVQIRLRE